MADDENTYIIPLRKVKMRSRRKRAPYAIHIIKEYIQRHMKVSEKNIWIDNQVNEKIWERGIEKPPTKIKVKAVKFEEGEVVEVLMPD